MKRRIAAACLLAASVGSASDGKPWVIINEDCNSTIARLSPEKVSRAGLREHFEQVIYGPTLTHYFINPQAQKACYASDVMERCWDDVGTNGLVRSDVVALKKFYDDGIDPYAVWVDVAREHKVSPWISMRMNDIHGVQEENPLQTSRMFRTRRDLWRKPNGYDEKNDTIRAFDYSHPEVFDFHLKIARELIERYDADGIECDWLRDRHNLTYLHEREKADVLTRFMREVRKLANAKATRTGRPYSVAVRVSARLDAATGLGTDVVRWVKDGSVDVVIFGSWFRTVDFGASFDDWSRAIRAVDGNVRLIAGGDCMVERRGYWQRDGMTLHDWAGYLDLAYSSGVDGGAYLFNYFAVDGQTPIVDLVSHQGLTHAKLKAMRRDYSVTGCDTLADDMPSAQQLQTDLNLRCDIRVQIGRPEPDDRVLVRLYDYTGRNDAFPLETVTLNGFRPRRIKDGHTLEFPRVSVKPGWNTVGIGPKPGTVLGGLVVSLEKIN